MRLLSERDDIEKVRWFISSGICCDGAPHHIRSMAEELERKVLASKYSAEMSKHPVPGKGNIFYEIE